MIQNRRKSIFSVRSADREPANSGLAGKPDPYYVFQELDFRVQGRREWTGKDYEISSSKHIDVPSQPNGLIIQTRERRVDIQSVVLEIESIDISVTLSIFSNGLAVVTSGHSRYTSLDK